MTDLRDRIAAVQREHRLGRSVVPGHDPGYICECGWRSEPDCTWTDHPEHVADVVIEELGLRQQVAGPDGIAYGKHRFVTDWIANE